MICGRDLRIGKREAQKLQRRHRAVFAAERHANLRRAGGLIQNQSIGIHVAVGISLAANTGPRKSLSVGRPVAKRVRFCLMIRTMPAGFNSHESSRRRLCVPRYDEFVPRSVRFDFGRKKNCLTVSVLRPRESGKVIEPDEIAEARVALRGNGLIARKHGRREQSEDFQGQAHRFSLG